MRAAAGLLCLAIGLFVLTGPFFFGAGWLIGMGTRTDWAGRLILDLAAGIVLVTIGKRLLTTGRSSRRASQQRS